MSIHDAIGTIRSNLLRLKPAGPDGFEGLAATAAAALSQLTIRLAKSGLQFGRDASSSPSDHFAVALEAKLYKDALSLEDLAGKTLLAEIRLGGRADVWMIASTGELGDETVIQLTDILEDKGVTLLALDWAARPLPPLAVFLAAARPSVISWLSARTTHVDADELDRALEAVESHVAYAGAAQGLEQSLQAAHVGLDALRRRNAEWVRKRLQDPKLSRRSFGQLVTVAAPTAPAIVRGAVLDKLSASIRADPDDYSITVVQGEEGVGKTWLVAQWWAAQSAPPILVLFTGRAADRLNPAEPLSALAYLLAEQEERRDPAALAKWERRLRRWKGEGVAAALRFLVVLDGLNEHALLPWSELISALAPEVQALGGRLVVTTRTGFWRRDVVPRLGTSVAIEEVTVKAYDDAELAAVLATRGRDRSQLPKAVGDFIRNPRICAVALDLLDRLVLTGDELTVERLLLEYWRSRLEERGDAVAHNVEDFHKVLREHARAWLAVPRRVFDRDDWSRYSGVAKRLGLERALKDLHDIEEGRFLSEIQAEPGAYGFRDEALPFALALLINQDLTQAETRGASVKDALEQMLEPVRGFDQLADIIVASAGLACMAERTPPQVCEILVRAWLGLQNVRDETFEAMAAYVPARPTAFLDVAELPADRIDPVRRGHSLTGLLLYRRDHPAVTAALTERLPRWLGGWSRRARIHFRGDDQAQRQVRHQSAVEASLAALASDEMDYFRAVTEETSMPPEMALPSLAARLIASRSQATYAAGMVGWGLATAVAGDYPDGQEDLAWSVRLNEIDWMDVRIGVAAQVERLKDAQTPIVRSGVARAMRLVGDERSSAEADALSPLTFYPGWHRADLFCDTDPFDPGSEMPSNLDNARAALQRTEPATTWLHMSHTSEDHDLELAAPGLTRFDPAPLFARFRSIVGTMPERTGLALRQLGWRLPWLSPLFGEVEIEAVRTALNAVLTEPGRLASDDLNWISGQLVEALLPHLDAEAQLDLILALPPGTPLYVNLRRGLKPLPAERLETRLEAARDNTSEMGAFTRTLFHASGSSAALTARTRDIVANAFFDGDNLISWAAADIVRSADDLDLDLIVVSKAVERLEPVEDDDTAFARARAITLAVVRTRRVDAVDILPVRFLGAAVDELGGPALDRIGDAVQAALERLSKPIKAEAPPNFANYFQTSRDDLEAVSWLEATPFEGELDPHEAFRELANPEQASRASAARHKAALERIHAYRRDLAAEGASVLLSSPPRTALVALARHQPRRVEGWMGAIVRESDEITLNQVRNLGLAIAAAGVELDPNLAATLLEKLRDRSSVANVVVGEAQTPLYLDLLFGAGEFEVLGGLRREVFDSAYSDEALETATVAAEAAGASAWLDRYIADLLASPTPGHQARGLTISAFRRSRALSFDRSLATGFMGDVVKHAHTVAQSALHARHWLDLAIRTPDPTEFWRFAHLAEGTVDRVVLSEMEETDPFEFAGTPMKLFGADLIERLRKAAKDRSAKRKEMLFGIKAPSKELLVALSDRERRH